MILLVLLMVGIHSDGKSYDSPCTNKLSVALFAK